MTPLIILSAILGLPMILALLFRVRPMYLFIAIVTGYFWAQFLGDSAEVMISSFVHVPSPHMAVRLLLLLLPVILTMLLTRKSLTSAALPIQFLLLIADSVLLATFIVPILSAGLQSTIYSTPIGGAFRQSHDIIVSAVSGIFVLAMILMRPKPHSKHRK